MMTITKIKHCKEYPHKPNKILRLDDNLVWHILSQIRIMDLEEDVLYWGEGVLTCKVDFNNLKFYFIKNDDITTFVNYTNGMISASCDSFIADCLSSGIDKITTLEMMVL
jgi:hypothetical protein